MYKKTYFLFKNNIIKILSFFIFVFMFCSLMLPIQAFALSESIAGNLTLELVSSGGGGEVVPSGGGGSTVPIDASTSTSTGEFNLLPIILGAFAIGFIALLIYLYKTHKLKNKTLSIFTLCLIVSVGACGIKTIVANAMNNDTPTTQGISTSSYLKFNESGEILENRINIVNSSEYTLNIESVTVDGEYKNLDRKSVV